MSDPGRLEIQAATLNLTLPGAHTTLNVARKGTGQTDAYQRLETVKRALDSSSRSPRWFEDEDVRAGDWVQFDVPVTYAVIDSGAGRQLFFAQTRNPVRPLTLLLYGSELNLLASDLPEHRADALASTVDNLSTVIRGLADSPESSLIGACDGWLRRGVLEVLNRLDGPLVAGAHVEGWARAVTTVPLDAPPAQVLIATPLYVRYAGRRDV